MIDDFSIFDWRFYLLLFAVLRDPATIAVSSSTSASNPATESGLKDLASTSISSR